MATAVHDAAAREFDAQRHFLWGFCYRMTGSTADADALVQEAFVRALERPPADLATGWRACLGWLAAALSLDVLRMRQRREYVGPWLPAPVETGNAASRGESQEDVFDVVESLTMPFLMALEGLTPRQRAVLLLRAVFAQSVPDTAAALDLTFPTVKATLQKALTLMGPYRQQRLRPTREAQARVAALLHEFLDHLQHYDVQGIEAMLAADVRALSDSGGEFVAPTTPVVRRDKVVRLLMKLAERRGPPTRYAFRMLNAMPAVVAEVPAPAVWAQRFVFRIDIAVDGLIREVHTIVAPRKLAAVRFDPA